MILVAGATSTPGRILLPLLLHKGYQVRALTRDPGRLAAYSQPGLEIWPGDLREPSTIRMVCEGVEAVVSAVTGFPAAGDNNLQTVDAAGNRLLMEAARRSGARHFVLVSGFGACAGHAVGLCRIRYETEEYLRLLGIPFTVLRPTAYMERWCLPVGENILRGRPVGASDACAQPANFISAADVASFIVIALEDPRLRNQVLAIGGPQTFTLPEVVSLYERLLHTRARPQDAFHSTRSLLARVFPRSRSAAKQRASLLHEVAAMEAPIDMRPVLEQFPVHLTRLDELAARQFEAMAAS